MNLWKIISILLSINLQKAYIIQKTFEYTILGILIIIKQIIKLKFKFVKKNLFII